MPLNVNVGLSRKRSENYQSDGVSINLTAELDSALLARPSELQQQIAGLYAQAEEALARQPSQLGESIAPPPVAGGRRPAQRPSNGYASRPATNGASGNGRGGNGGGQMTESQRKAIFAISRRADIDPAYDAREIVGAELDDLTLRQASDLIDHLKALQPAPANGRNGR